MQTSGRLSHKLYEPFRDEISPQVLESLKATLRAEDRILRAQLRTEFITELGKLRVEMLNRHTESLLITFLVFWSGSIVALAGFGILR